MLPEVVTESEYPKHIRIPFIQSSNEVQLFCTVEHDKKKLRDTQNIANLQTLAKNNQIIHKALDIIIPAKGEWKFMLKGRYLDENVSISALMDYTVKGL